MSKLDVGLSKSSMSVHLSLRKLQKLFGMIKNTGCRDQVAV